MNLVLNNIVEGTALIKNTLFYSVDAAVAHKHLWKQLAVNTIFFFLQSEKIA